MNILSYHQFSIASVNPFPANVPIMEKPGSWFLLAKFVKNACGRETF